MSIYLAQNQKKITIYIWQKNIIKRVVKKGNSASCEKFKNIN